MPGRPPISVGKKKNSIHVTVCIAAICNNDMVICAADRMLTADDIEFEPQNRKIDLLTKSMAVMMAGDSSIQEEILQNVRKDIRIRIEKAPINSLNLSDVADIYVHYYYENKRKKAEAEILGPLGLNVDSFISRQQQMDHYLVEKLANDMRQFDMQQIGAIFAGVDTTGPHIYSIIDGHVQCHDRVGFASIGIGARHSSSEFMFVKYDPSRDLAETLFLIYVAKKRAEVAPGVGRATDLLFIGPKLGMSYTPPEKEDVFKELEKIYNQRQGGIKRSEIRARNKFSKYIDKINKETVLELLKDQSNELKSKKLEDPKKD